MAKFCTTCGSALGDGAKFCTTCGTATPKTAEETAAKPAPKSQAKAKATEAKAAPAPAAAPVLAEPPTPPPPPTPGPAAPAPPPPPSGWAPEYAPPPPGPSGLTIGLGLVVLIALAGIIYLLATRDSGEGGNAASNVTAATTNSTADAAVAPSGPNAAAASSAPFSIYQWSGRTPFEAGPNGPSFLTDPSVRAMASAAVANQSILTEIDIRQGPQSPIVVEGKRLLAWGCEAHNCGGGFNWAMVVVDSRRGHYMRICVHDGARMGGWSEWYEAGRLKARIQGECPSSLAGFR